MATLLHVSFSMYQPLLAAIRFGDNQNIDQLLEEVVNEFQKSGKLVRGALQLRGSGAGECYCADMDLRLISSGQVFRISQPLGSGSAGCRLHPGVLAECSACLEQQIEKGCDLLVLNRFGKGESEGRGFRDLISKALLSGIPVLTATRATYADAWNEFSGEMGIELPCERSSIYKWYEALNGADAA